MNKITYYTAYLPEPRVVVDRARRSESAIANNQLGDCARRLDKQTQKLENLDQSCLTNIAKCNRFYNNARKCVLSLYFVAVFPPTILAPYWSE